MLIAMFSLTAAICNSNMADGRSVLSELVTGIHEALIEGVSEGVVSKMGVD